MKGKRVFISGGAGVIGTALVEKLLAVGAEIFVGDLKPLPKQWAKKLRYRQGDLNLIHADELADFAPHFFFHLAATFERSTETYDFWDETYKHNVQLSHHLMSCLRSSPSLEKVIFASSYLIYDPKRYSFPTPAEKPIRLSEEDPIYPRNLCGTAKLLHEVELHFLASFAEFKAKTVSARIFRSYGKDSRDIISRWVRSLLRDETLTAYKTEGWFDYIYADDVAEGLSRLAQSNATGIVNLGTDNAQQVSQVLKELEKHFPKMKVNSGDLDIQYEASQANMDRFQTLTGWKPTRTIADVIPEIIRFEKQNPDRDIAVPAELPILVTSISKKVPMLKALRAANAKLGNSAKLFGADANADCIGKYFVDNFWKMPTLKTLKIEEFLAFCKQQGIRGVIPSRDGELAFFSEHRDQLAKHGIMAMISSPTAINTCTDKLHFYQHFSKLGLPVIFTAEILDEVKGDRFVVKERFGAGSRSMGISLNRLQAAEHAKSLENPIFQPMIAGQEYSVDLYVSKNGKAKGAISRRRELVVDGESQITTTDQKPVLEALCVKMAENLGLYGHAVFQAFEDSKNQFHLIECNSRFGGASTLSLATGLDSFYWFLLESSGVDIAEYPFIRSREELRQVRVAADHVTRSLAAHDHSF